MDDKELIKRIMEEVKDEKLREELLALMVEKNKKKDDAKQEEERPIDYVARQKILFGATEGVAKVEWWISFIGSIVFIIISIVFILVGSLGPLGLLGYFLTPAEERGSNDWFFIFFFSILFIMGLGFFILGLGSIFSLRSGKKEYERLKRKRENQRQS
ncbi:hypothetical protein [Thermocrinis sp.]|uniref:hypothetical protein n=1 Tax=Thermocrinis sp. TaxID=2024383 RepID=UPI003C056FD7